jgi:uncharacterized membrane-anchored protein YitT (DUF2179 family)
MKYWIAWLFVFFANIFLCYLYYKYSGDHHILNRFGANLAVSAVLFAIVEHRIAMKLTDDELTLPIKMENLPHYSSTEVVASNKLKDFFYRRAGDRRGVSISTSVFLLIGEFMHGWGDIIIAIFK